MLSIDKINEIKEGNNIIAPFMKFEVTLSRQHYFLDEFDSYGYANSWDWLMPVVEKIEQVGYIINITDTYCVIINHTKERFTKISINANSKIEATWQAVVEFIKWYNTQNS